MIGVLGRHPALRSLAQDRFVQAFAVVFLAELGFYLVPAAAPAIGGFGRDLFLLPFLVVVAAGALAGLPHVADREERRFWRTLAVSCSAWLLGALASAIVPEAHQRTAPHLLVDALYLCCYVPLLLAVEWRPHHGTTLMAWDPDRWVQVLSAGCVVFGWFAYFVVVPAWLDASFYGSSIRGSVYDVALELMLVGLYYFAGRRCRVPRWRVLYWAVGAACLAVSVASTLDLLVQARVLNWRGSDLTGLVWVAALLASLLALRLRHAPLGSWEETEARQPGFTSDDRTRSGALLLGGAFSFPLVHLWLQPALSISSALRHAQGLVVLAMLGVLGALTILKYRLLGRRHRTLEESHQHLLHRLREVHRLDAVGRLAGGVAHDFNNMLTGIVGYNDMALQALPADDPNRPALEQIADASAKAAKLTQQVLALSRRQILKPERTNVNTIIGQAEPALRRVLGHDVRLAIHLAPHLHDVWADPSQMQDVVRALTANARDAIPGGGTIDISTANVRISRESWPADPSRAPGDYVEVSVRDSGPDIPLANQFHQFEPFYAAGGKGRGAGLSLAAVHGIVMQSGGTIEVRSEPGEGAEFVVRLPRTGGRSEPVAEPAGPATDAG